MSTFSTLKSGLVAATCLAGLTLTACASHSGSSGRYGSVYDYESGGNCGASSCAAAPVVAAPVSSRYGSGSSSTVIGGQPVSPGVVYADCSQIGGMNCAPAPAPMPAPAPAPTYSSGVTYTGGPVDCPAGTTANGDGTCMMTGSGTYSGSTSYGSSSGSSYSSSSSSSIGAPVECPAGTTPANDGTCLQSSTSGYSSYSSSSSSSSYTPSSGQMADCPAGTISNGDGTCMETGSGRVEIYTGGYQAPETYTPPTTYLPIRK